MEVALGSGCPAYSGSVLVIADVGARGGAGGGHRFPRRRMFVHGIHKNWGSEDGDPLFP